MLFHKALGMAIVLTSAMFLVEGKRKKDEPARFDFDPNRRNLTLFNQGGPLFEQLIQPLTLNNSWHHAAVLSMVIKNTFNMSMMVDKNDVEGNVDVILHDESDISRMSTYQAQKPTWQEVLDQKTSSPGRLSDNQKKTHQKYKDKLTDKNLPVVWSAVLESAMKSWLDSNRDVASRSNEDASWPDSGYPSWTYGALSGQMADRHEIRQGGQKENDLVMAGLLSANKQPGCAITRGDTGDEAEKARFGLAGNTSFTIQSYVSNTITLINPRKEVITKEWDGDDSTWKSNQIVDQGFGKVEMTPDRFLQAFEAIEISRINAGS